MLLSKILGNLGKAAHSSRSAMQKANEEALKKSIESLETFVSREVPQIAAQRNELMLSLEKLAQSAKV